MGGDQAKAGDLTKGADTHSGEFYRQVPGTGTFVFPPITDAILDWKL